MTEKRRGKRLQGETYQLVSGCGDMYITINTKNNELFEMFITMGKCGVCALAQCSAIAKLVSLSLQAGVSPKKLIKHLSGITCQSPANVEGEKILSCADAVAIALKFQSEKIESEKGEVK
jgi:ribonucleoside-diphosphate reductase alpha chain